MRIIHFYQFSSLVLTSNHTIKPFFFLQDWCRLHVVEKLLFSRSTFFSVSQNDLMFSWMSRQNRQVYFPTYTIAFQIGFLEIRSSPRVQTSQNLCMQYLSKIDRFNIALGSNNVIFIRRSWNPGTHTPTFITRTQTPDENRKWISREINTQKMVMCLGRSAENSLLWIRFDSVFNSFGSLSSIYTISTAKWEDIW